MQKKAVLIVAMCMSIGGLFVSCETTSPSKHEKDKKEWKCPKKDCTHHQKKCSQSVSDL